MVVGVGFKILSEHENTHGHEEILAYSFLLLGYTDVHSRYPPCGARAL